MLPQRLLIQKSIFVVQIICGGLVNRKFYEPIAKLIELFCFGPIRYGKFRCTPIVVKRKYFICF